MSFGAGFNQLGQAVGDLYTAKGDKSEEGAYRQGAALAYQNINIEKSSTAIQLAQNQRKIYQTQGAIKANAGGNGLRAEGSVTDILRTSAQQGALSQALIGTQGQINENSYAAQATALTGEAEAASAAARAKEAEAAGNMIGGIMSFI